LLRTGRSAGELVQALREAAARTPAGQWIISGAFADVVGFRADLLNCPVDDLPSQQPALTLVGGRPVHDPDGLLGSAGVSAPRRFR
jgi:predicted amidohydrolase YtcJ